MALGNNLKGIKRDSLIPTKKESSSNPKAKKAIKATKSKTKLAVKKQNKATLKTKANSIAKPKQKVADKISNKIPAINKPKEVAIISEEHILVGGKSDSPITIKLQPSRRKTVRKTKLILEGSLSLLEAELIKNALMTTFAAYDVIDIQLLNITHLDIIPVQLFKLFVHFYPDKKVKIDSDLPFDMKIILERAGFGLFMFKEKAA